MSDHVSIETGTDEYGELVWNWFCHGCGEGGSTYDARTTTTEADDHMAAHERAAGEDETA